MDITVYPTEPTHRRQYPGENFYVQVDGKNVGEKNNMWYKSKREAMAVGRRYVLAVENTRTPQAQEE